MIRSLLSRNLPIRAIGEDDDLLGSGLLDSVGVLSLVAGLEKTFGVKIDTTHLTQENFQSIRSIANLVHRLTAETKLQ
jgi:acyl carrier protein